MFFSKHIFTFLLLSFFLPLAEAASLRTVRIGVYDNPPTVSTGTGGVPEGIFIDIIKRVAEKEGWKLQYIPGNLQEGMRRLEADSIDLMPDVEFSQSSTERLDFNQLAILSSWLRVFHREGDLISSVGELEGKRIATLQGSVQEHLLREELAQRLAVSFQQIVFPDHQSVVESVRSGTTDVALLGRFYDYQRPQENLIASSVTLNPSTRYFAAKKGHNTDLLHAIDRHVSEMMTHWGSAYYQSLSPWLSEQPRTSISRTVLFSIFAILLALTIFLLMNRLLRLKVNKQSDQLREKNKLLASALDELQQTQNEAIKQERLYILGQLASGVAHDFSNFLVPIMTYADLMLSDESELEDKKAVQQRLNAMKSAASRGAELVHSMQNFCCFSNRSKSHQEVDVNELIHEAVALCQKQWLCRGADTNSITVSFQLCDEAKILGTKNEIAEMILTLVLNAADAMAQGGLLEVTTERSDNTIRLVVTDNGCGMSPETRKRCFQPFFTTKGVNSTGIGLTMVKNIIASHSGHMRVITEEGKGTSFVVEFPQHTKQATTTA